MPTYLCHGFRWYRKSIRVFIVLNDLEDAAADWVVGTNTSSALLNAILDNYDYLPEPSAGSKPPSQRPTPQRTPLNLHLDEDLKLPDSKVDPAADKVLCHDWSPVKLLEEFDPREERRAVRPYVFIADHVLRVDLHADVALEMQKYEELVRQAGRPWFEQLRSEIQPQEQIRWYVVTCADDERPV